jgi:hypothetical protein
LAAPQRIDGGFGLLDPVVDLMVRIAKTTRRWYRGVSSRARARARKAYENRKQEEEWDRMDPFMPDSEAEVPLPSRPASVISHPFSFHCSWVVPFNLKQNEEGRPPGRLNGPGHFEWSKSASRGKLFVAIWQGNGIMMAQGEEEHDEIMARISAMDICKASRQVVSCSCNTVATKASWFQLFFIPCA